MTLAEIVKLCGWVGPGDTCTYAHGHTNTHSWEGSRAPATSMTWRVGGLADLAELRRLAEAATAGPWGYEASDPQPTKDGTFWEIAPVRPSHEDDDDLLDHLDWTREVAATAGDVEADAAYIAAANPDTILALLDLLAADRRETVERIGQRIRAGIIQGHPRSKADVLTILLAILDEEAGR